MALLISMLFRVEPVQRDRLPQAREPAEGVARQHVTGFRLPVLSFRGSVQPRGIYYRLMLARTIVTLRGGSLAIGLAESLLSLLFDLCPIRMSRFPIDRCESGV